MDLDFDALSKGFDLLNKTINSLKGLKDLLPHGKEKETVQKNLEQAEQSTKLAEAQIAKGLGYDLCQCTFPPQIMLQVGEEVQCPKCKRRLSDVISTVTVDTHFDPRRF